MSARVYVLKQIKIIQNVEGADLSGAAAWATAVDLGELKASPYLKLTWEPKDPITTQKGKKGLGVTAKFETSTFEVDDTVLDDLKAMRGMNVSLQCIPRGTVSASNPIIIIKDFPLMLGGEINIGGEHIVKLSGERDAFDEGDFYETDASEV